MKVLQINATYGDGSTGTIVKDIHELMLSKGFDAHIAYAVSSFNRNNIRNGYKIGNKFDRKIHALLTRIAGRQGHFSHFSTFKLLKYIDRIKPDVIHLHNLHNNYINIPVLLKYIAKRGLPLILTLHDCWFYTGGCTHYFTEKCFKWKDTCGFCPKRLQDFPAYLHDSSSYILNTNKKLFSRIKKLCVVGVSNWITEEAKTGIFKNNKCLCIHNGVDLSIFKPTVSNIVNTLHLENKKILLGPASKWLLPENHDKLLQISKILNKNIKLILFGAKKSEKAPFENIITYPFTKSKEELAQLYSIADLFLNISLEDSLSLINVEAQACGCPVVCFDTTGLSDTVDNQNSFKVSPDNFELYIEKVKELLKNKTYPIGYIKDNFNIKTNYQKYLNLYYDIANSYC